MNKPSQKNNTLKYLFFGGLAAILCLAVFGVAAWTAVNHPAFASILPKTQPPAPIVENNWAQVNIVKPLPNPADGGVISHPNVDPLLALDATPGPEISSSPTDQPTDIPTSVPTEEPTSIPEPTETPAQLAMEIVPPTPTREYVPPAPGEKPVYPSIGNGERWIDVDLTRQMTYAYEGDVIVNSFVVSTGTWATPTVTGQYKVYVKYRSAKMSGPGYYLPNVPYIMYFYKGYGLHGTYWHNNFGTPMSHGCVNLRTSDAEWLFNWASVGTLVNVHY